MQPREETLKRRRLTRSRVGQDAEPEGCNLRVNTKSTSHPGDWGCWPQQHTQPLCDLATPRWGTPPGNGYFGPSDTCPRSQQPQTGSNADAHSPGPGAQWRCDHPMEPCLAVDRRALLTHSLQFSCSFVSDSLRPHGLQHPRPPCPSPTPRVYANSCPSSW